ncbi:hypothetical protein [Bacillus sp. AK031]
MKLLNLTFFVLLTLMLTACGSNNEGAGNENSSETNEIASVDDDAEEKTESVQSEEETITLDGTFVGQVDPQSIEFKTAEEIYILQTMEAEVDFNTVPEGSSVTVEFYENEAGQNILKNIEVTE